LEGWGYQASSYPIPDEPRREEEGVINLHGGEGIRTVSSRTP